MKRFALFIVCCSLLLPLRAQSSWHKVIYPGSMGYGIAIQPATNGATIRPSDGRRGLFYSADQGHIWKHLDGPYNPSNEPLEILRHGSKDSIVVVDGRDQFGTIYSFLSKNLGQTWKEIQSPPGGITTAPLIVYQGQVFTFNYFPCVYREQENRWDTILQKPMKLYVQEQTLWAYSELGVDSLYKSVDAGQTWQATIRLSANRLLIHGDTIVTTYPFQRSFDGGSTWEDLPPFGPVYELFDDGQYQYLVSSFETIRSTDFFQTYDTLFDEQILNLIRLDHTHLLASGTYGCYRSVDNGLNWERSNSGIGLNENGYGVTNVGDYLVAYTIFGASNNFRVQAFSSDTAQSWTGSVDYPYLGQLIQVQDDYFGTLGITIYRSKNDVTHWQPLSFPDIEGYSNLKLAAWNDTLLAIATTPDPSVSRMWWSDTKVEPAVFHQIATPLPFSPKGLVAHKNALYITEDFNVRKSVNLGQSWQTVTKPGIGGGLYSDGNRLYFIGFQGILYSENGGNSWDTIPFPTNMVGQLQRVTVAETAIYLNDTGGHIFYQNSGTTVWDTLPGFPSGVGPGAVATFGPYLFVPDYFGEIWTNSPAYVGTATVNDGQGFLVFPNPMENSIHVQFPEDSPTGNVLRVFAQNGTLVFEGKNLPNPFTLATDNWANGLYYFLEYSGRRIYSRKVVKAGRF